MSPPRTRPAIMAGEEGNKGTMRQLRVVLIAGLLAVFTSFGFSPDAGATPIVHKAAVSFPAVDSPSPTLGSTPQPGVNPPGDSDADADDFDQVPLVVISFLALGLLVGGSVLFYLWRRSRPTREKVRREKEAPPGRR